MIIRLIMAASLAVTLVSSTAVGETYTFEERYARFNLFADCGPMGLIVKGLSEDAKKIGLTKESIQAAGESRLRAARLYSAGAARPYLYITVLVLGDAHGVSLKYKKSVSDPLSGEEAAAATWEAGFIGTHARSGSAYILSGLSQYLDEFLVEYLRVNEDACGKR